jgi:hypothetical protein
MKVWVYRQTENSVKNMIGTSILIYVGGKQETEKKDFETVICF